MSPSPPRPSLLSLRSSHLQSRLCPPRALPTSFSAVRNVHMRCHPIEGDRQRGAKRSDSNPLPGIRDSLCETAWKGPPPISRHRCRRPPRRPKYRCRAHGTTPHTTGQSPASWERCPGRAHWTRWPQSRLKSKRSAPRRRRRLGPSPLDRRPRGGATGHPDTDRTA